MRHNTTTSCLIIKLEHSSPSAGPSGFPSRAPPIALAIAHNDPPLHIPTLLLPPARSTLPNLGTNLQPAPDPPPLRPPNQRPRHLPPLLRPVPQSDQQTPRTAQTHPHHPLKLRITAPARLRARNLQRIASRGLEIWISVLADEGSDAEERRDVESRSRYGLFPLEGNIFQPFVPD